MKRFPSFLASFQVKKQDPPASPDAKAIAEIEKAGGAVRKLAQNDEHLEVTYQLQGAQVTDKDLAPMAQLKNVTYLNLGKTSITDAAMTEVARHNGLTQLHLEMTKITDAGLARLKGLDKLEYLNLYGTAVTDAGLASLANLKSLKNLYLWQAKVTPEGVKKLKEALPKTDINTGWEIAPAPPAPAPAK